MSQPNPKNEATLDIDRLSYGPYGIGRVEGRVMMVPRTASGDTIVARVVEDKDRFSIGELVRVVRSSPVRRTPPCPYAGTCGGCSWQHIEYEHQLQAKRQSVEDALRRIGKLSGYDLRSIIPAGDEFHYRRRIRLQVGPGRELGFYGASSHDLVQIDACLIAAEPLSAEIATLRRWVRAMNSNIEHVEIVSGDQADETVAVVQIAGDFIPRDEPVCESLIGEDGGIHGLIVAAQDLRKVWGEPRITLALGDDLELKVDGDVFTQVNPVGNRRILQELLSAGAFQSSDQVLELFAGAGNFTLPIARRVNSVVAVEGDRSSVNNGKLNAQRNDIDNIRWICSAVPKAVVELKRKRERFDKIVLDPPRAGFKGMEADLAALGAARILYVSCNPTTLARDLAALTKQEYKLRTVQPIDLFPQTFHVETLTVLEREG
ncbi:MAG TPA: 23S rRNA (uracil(1939)-C(5))-methyltransferase RlmD [Candidatus Binatia bacterium]|nr:23S rRNA (uracil(1939)-C(5))-methyltransferase RlmD [Candidatus Binatia bacterium]